MENIPRTDLKLLRYFLAVAEELHFGRAAARLHMSQPPLSLHIKELESQLNTPLFIRHSRSVTLTPAGRVLMEEARALIAQANRMLAKVEQIGRGEAGRITLGMVGTALWGGVRPAIHRFMKDNPQVEIAFKEKSPGMQQVLLERGELDVGIWRMVATPPPGFTSQRLHQAAFLVALPGDHPLCSMETIPLAALRDESFITLPRQHSDWAFLLKICSQAGFEPHITREVVEPQTILALISMGLGVTLMADSYAQMHWPDVVFRPLASHIAADLYVVYDQQQVTPTTQRFIDAIVPKQA